MSSTPLEFEAHNRTLECSRADWMTLLALINGESTRADMSRHLADAYDEHPRQGAGFYNA